MKKAGIIFAVGAIALLIMAPTVSAFTISFDVNALFEPAKRTIAFLNKVHEITANLTYGDNINSNDELILTDEEAWDFSGDNGLCVWHNVTSDFCLCGACGDEWKIFK